MSKAFVKANVTTRNDLILWRNKLVDNKHVLSQFSAQLANILQQAFHLTLVFLL